MCMSMMRSMATFVFQRMCQAVRYEIQSHEKETNGHAKASYDLGAFETKGMSNSRAFPHFEVGPYVDGNAKERT